MIQENNKGKYVIRISETNLNKTCKTACARNFVKLFQRALDKELPESEIVVEYGYGFTGKIMEGNLRKEVSRIMNRLFTFECSVWCDC